MFCLSSCVTRDDLILCSFNCFCDDIAKKLDINKQLLPMILSFIMNMLI